jgi:DNA polymerase III sliding clamp (beta) subunit (PCNA family)
MNQDQLEQRLHQLTYEVIESNKNIAELANLILLLKQRHVSATETDVIYSVAARLALQSRDRVDRLSRLNPLNLNH